MKMKYYLDFKPYNVGISDKNVLFADNNNSTDFKKFSTELMGEGFSVIEIEDDGITIQKKDLDDHRIGAICIIENGESKVSNICRVSEIKDSIDEQYVANHIKESICGKQ